MSQNVGYSEYQERKILMITEISKVGRRGTIVIPAGLRRLYNVEEGSFIMAEGTAEGILLRRAAVLPIESYTPERKAEFLLSNAVDDDEYSMAVKVVRETGIDPAKVTHHKPAGLRHTARRGSKADA